MFALVLPQIFDSRRSSCRSGDVALPHAGLASVQIRTELVPFLSPFQAICPIDHAAFSMKPICIDCRYIGARPSGIAEAVIGLLQHIPALAPDLSFLLLRGPHREQPLSTAPNVREVVTRAPVNGPGTMWFLSQMVDLRAVGLFHATANFLPANLAMPTLTTIHDIMWLTDPQWCNPSFYGRIERAFYGHGIKRAMNRSSRIVALSQATADAILERQPDAQARLSVIHSGVSERFHPIMPDPERLEQLGLPAGHRFVLTVGQSSPYKNHGNALRAFADAFGACEDVSLVLVQRQARGRGALHGLATQLGIAERVIAMPAVSTHDLLLLYSSAQVLLHPSLAEGFGNPVAEAMACGCPVITSNCSAMPEVAGGAARLVDPLDVKEIAAALRDVLNAPDTQSAMREAGLARARELDWESAARKYVSLYREIMAEG